MRRRIALLAAVLAAVLAVTLVAQQPSPQPSPRFTAGVQLIEVYATVTSAAGDPVQNLKQSDFTVTEDGQPQTISAFAAGEFPLAVALGIDRSWSMAGEPLRLARQASQAFLRELRPGDRSMVLAISNEAEVIAPMSEDRTAQIGAIGALEPWSTTALQDAVIVALDRLAPEAGRQALIVFSDGVDRYSQATPAQVLARARRSNALVYPIGFGRTRPALLAELAVLTGGRSFLLRDARELQPALATIARELRHQYLIGYVPSRAADAGRGEWRSITVSVKNQPAGTRVRARDGYTTE